MAKKKIKRGPSAYNLFVAEQVKQGKTMIEATRLWKAQSPTTQLPGESELVAKLQEQYKGVPDGFLPGVTIKQYILKHRPHLKNTLGEDDEDRKLLKTLVDSPIGQRLTPLIDDKTKLTVIRKRFKQFTREEKNRAASEHATQMVAEMATA